MNTFPHVEDYLEVLAGKRSISGVLTTSPLMASFMLATFKPIVSLARYDVSFLDNVTDQTLAGTALTDRQSELCVKLIGKYRRQLLQLEIDVDAITATPAYRKPIRVIDRTCEMFVNDAHVLCMRFPYNNKLVETIRDFSKMSQGSVKFNKDNKIWHIGLTEFNVNWAVAMGKSNGFTIDDRLLQLQQQIEECEAAEYHIQLTVTETGYTIVNADNSLVQWIEQHGGFGHENLDHLVDWAPVLGYTVDPVIMQHMEERHGASTALLLNAREYEFGGAATAETVQRVVSYAHKSNRWPIVVFNPTPDDTFDIWRNYFDETQVLRVNNKRQEELVTGAHKVVYTHLPLYRSNMRIPVLVSHVGMIVGHDKAAMIALSDKIFFAGVKLSN